MSNRIVIALFPVLALIAACGGEAAPDAAAPEGAAAAEEKPADAPAEAAPAEAAPAEGGDKPADAPAEGGDKPAEVSTSLHTARWSSLHLAVCFLS
jgi:hypothetical protein